MWPSEKNELGQDQLTERYKYYMVTFVYSYDSYLRSKQSLIESLVIQEEKRNVEKEY